MIELREWQLSYEVMNSLYYKVDQSKCLVQMAVPLERAGTFRYLQAVQAGISNGKALYVRGIWLDGVLIGKAELSRYETGDAELDIVIASPYCAKGYGAEAMRLLEEEVKKSGWCRSIYAYVDTSNIAAGKMLAKCGFEAGRFFSADVMIPYEGTYAIKTARGCEMKKIF
jgi:RimJ/RimL family protein N-acetyltransferase